jgi:branched-chain amino acid transport system ATP-binding protein
MCIAATGRHPQTLEEVTDVPDPARRRRPAGSLSGGQQQMVALGRALMRPPARAAARRAVAGPGAAGGQADVRDHPAHQSRWHHRAAPEQNAYAALGIAHRAYVIENGHIVMEGDRDTLLKDEGIRKAYIGG